MKSLLPRLALVALTSTALAGPLQREQVPADAKWLLHLDVDAFKAGQLGTFFMQELLPKKAGKVRDDLKNGLDFDLDWNRISALTAYGCRYEPKGDKTGVLLLRSTLDFRGGLETAFARSNPELRVEKFETTPNPFYRLNEDGYASVEPGGVLLLSKSRDSVLRAREVLGGREANLATSPALAGYPASPNAFFFMGVAEDWGQQAQLPPSAAVLRQASGGRLLLAEAGDRLHVNLDIKANTPDTAQQIQQVGLGLIALAALNGNQNPDLQALTLGATVTKEDQIVTVGVRLPLADVIKKIAEKNQL